MSTIAVSCASGAKRRMSEDWPNAIRPRSWATWSAAGLSVCWAMMSDPWSMSALAASASLPGSYQELTQMTLTVASGASFCIASVKELIPITTSGIGNEAM